MEVKTGWKKQYWHPSDSDLVWVAQFGMDCWVKEHSDLDRKKSRILGLH